MGFTKPTGKYADQVINPDGWPDVDEQAFLERSQKLLRVLQELSRSYESWMQEKSELSAGTLWSGSGATAGNNALEARANAMTNQQANLVRAVSWLNQQFSIILNTKIGIFDRVATTESVIASLEEADLKPDVRQERIDSLIKGAQRANVADCKQLQAR